MKTKEFQHLVDDVTVEIKNGLADISDEEITGLVRSVLSARSVFVHGSGRVGFACKGFAMRLGHLGFRSYALDDTTVPPAGKDDLVIVASSSGETQTVFDVAVLARTHGSQVVVITASRGSRIAKNADVIIEIRAQTKFVPSGNRTSIQPMATSFEQCLQVLFDVLILKLMKETNQSHEDMWKRHANLT